MKIDDLIQLLDNRLREFKLSRDYAKMSGNLERMNAADKEIITLDDTLFQLNLLVDTSKSAAVKKASLTEVLTDGSIAVLGEYDITPYATDPKHEEKIMNILSKMGVMDTVEKIDDYIKSKYLSSPVTGEMIMSAALAYSVDARLMMAIMEQDSSFGTAGKAVRTLNPGNVGNDDSGNTHTYESWQEGVTAVAEWLNRHRMSKIISEIPDTAASMPVAASSSEETIPVVTSTTTTTTASSSFSPTPPQSGDATAGQATPTPIVTVSPSPTSSPSFSPTPTPEVTTSTTTVTTTSTSTPTPEPSPSPTSESSPTPTPESSPTPEPTPEATPEPTPSPTTTPEPSPSPEQPSPEPSESPTSTPEPEPSPESTPEPPPTPTSTPN